ncbi:Holliday junction resolvase RuvX [Stenotrophomonas sp. W1S232]|jgi:RNAse H-fold protein YqgF|uniref:Putative pre-16S rRNA nuclease n=1 Tax=Stenotrophomonas koreensis TaxID=266128 RepID=A0A7W3V0E6_9GAMM|nr:Holliday junction resolvase RuvX [Stenotrophomonas koreensis]MBB1117101.1 Holliday junction resolvase RuvX [Stenotrophomonas koreensis]
MGTIAADATVLGFDVGSRRIGVAIGSAFALSARAIAVVEIPAAGIDWVALDRLLAEWRPQGLVVGDPLTLEGEDQPNRKRAHAFARQLLARYALPVVLVDERSSSIEAARRFAQQRAAGHKRRRDAASLDAVAAAVIIERWLDAPGDATPVSLAPHVPT